jgi:hypothetical protein
MAAKMAVLDGKMAHPAAAMLPEEDTQNAWDVLGSWEPTQYQPSYKEAWGETQIAESPPTMINTPPPQALKVPATKVRRLGINGGQSKLVVWSPDMDSDDENDNIKKAMPAACTPRKTPTHMDLYEAGEVYWHEEPDREIMARLEQANAEWDATREERMAKAAEIERMEKEAKATALKIKQQKALAKALDQREKEAALLLAKLKDFQREEAEDAERKNYAVETMTAYIEGKAHITIL